MSWMCSSILEIVLRCDGGAIQVQCGDGFAVIDAQNLSNAAGNPGPDYRVAGLGMKQVIFARQDHIAEHPLKAPRGLVLGRN